MKIEKLQLPKEKIDINLNFYFFLKNLVKLKPTPNQASSMLEVINLHKNNIDSLKERLEDIFDRSGSKKAGSKKVASKKLLIMMELGSRLSDLRAVDLFEFSLRLYQIKDLLLEEAKITESLALETLSNLEPLSLEYDKVSVLKPYKTRVSGALLALLFFEKLDNGSMNFMSKDACDIIANLSKQALEFKKQGLEPNQIFMLMFNESLNQSIISDSGADYESRIQSVLDKEGIENSIKTHDIDDSSIEYDFFFEKWGRTYGISAKRTLRERYKQFTNTTGKSKTNVLIQITIGLDLNHEKTNIITRQHSIYLFVADEVYESKDFLQDNEMVYSVKKLNLQTLETLGESH